MNSQLLVGLFQCLILNIFYLFKLTVVCIIIYVSGMDQSYRLKLYTKAIIRVFARVSV